MDMTELQELYDEADSRRYDGVEDAFRDYDNAKQWVKQNAPIREVHLTLDWWDEHNHELVLILEPDILVLHNLGGCQ